MSRRDVTGFKRVRGGGVAASFDADEERWLRQVLRDMVELLGADAEPATEPGTDPDDPVAAVFAEIGTSTRAPDDPALARLFPDGYRDDPEAAADFRRYTEPGLRAAKLANLRTALETLAPQRVVLDAAQADAWLRALNDTRLVLGERLAITEDWDEVVAALDDEDPRLVAFYIYERLTYLQEALVRALWSGS